VAVVSPSVVAVQERVPVSPLESALDEEVVKRWLRRLDEDTRPSYFYNFRGWLLWLWRIPEWSRKTPTQLLDWQENAKGRQRRILLDLMIDYVDEKGGSYTGMKSRLSHLRSFFLNSGVELPATGAWDPKPTHEPTKGALTPERVREIIAHASLRNMAIFLTMFQSLMDLERFDKFNRKYALPLATHLKERGVDEPFRIDFLAGRKRNRRAYYTFIFRDALTAWKNYFDRERGWPKREGESLALTPAGTPLKKEAIRAAFVTLAKQLKLRPKTTGGRPSGVAPHEAFRDVVRSLLQTAKKKGFDPICSEFWMGHSVDPYNYNKFAEQEPEYVLENAKIAAEYLNIISASAAEQESAKEVESLREEVAKLRGQFETILKTKFGAETAN